MTIEAFAPIFGFLLQYARAYKSFKDWHYIVVLLALTALATWLTYPDWSGGARDVVGQGILRAWVVGNAIAGGTLGAKLVSKVNSGVPQTNSK